MLPNSFPETGVSHHLGLPVAPRTEGAGAEHTEVGVASPHKRLQQGWSRRLASLPAAAGQGRARLCSHGTSCRGDPQPRPPCLSQEARCLLVISEMSGSPHCGL